MVSCIIIKSFYHIVIKMHSKCNVLEQSPNRLPTPVEKSSSVKPILVPKVLGTAASDATQVHGVQTCWHFGCLKMSLF